MGRLIVCKKCGRELPHRAFGLCHACYCRLWRRKNPEKNKIAVRRYQRRHPERAKGQSSSYKRRNKKKIKQYNHNYYLENRDRILARTTKWRKKNKDKVNATRRRSYSEDPTMDKTCTNRRRARRNLVPDTITREQVKLKMRSEECFYCGSFQSLELDHFVPLSKGGGTTLANVVVACRRCNSSKGTKLPEEMFVQLLLEEKSEDRRFVACG